MLKIRCLDCNTEVQAKPGQYAVCGCSNMATIRGENISAVDLSRIIIVSNGTQNKKNNVLSQTDLAWQEERKRRGVRKMVFDER
jgi:hypothetical protein